MVDYFAGLGVEAIFADHICLTLEDGQPPQEGLGQVRPMDYAREFLEARAYAEAKGVFYSNFLVVNFDEPVAIACRQGIPVPHLTPSGYVSSCDMAVDKTSTPMDALLYGVYRPRFGRIDYDQAAIERIRSRAVGALEACRDCPVEGYCAGGCAGEAINETGDFYGVKQNLCEATKFLAEALGVNHPRPYPYLHP
jgi:radical SAM protein with 4Fe4S-binding SPASM domain